MNKKEFEALCSKKYTEIGSIIAPDMTLDDARECFETMIAGQAALAMAVCGNIRSLTQGKLVPADLGRELELTAVQLASDIKKAMNAQTILDTDARASLADKVVH